MRIGDAIEHSVSLHPDRDALRQGDKSYTYNELLDEIKARNTGRGKRVAVISPHCIESVLTLLSNWYNGRTNIHINPKLDAEMLPYYVRDSGADTVLFHRELDIKTGALKDELGIEPLELGKRTEEEPPGVENGKQEPASITYTSGTTGDPKGVPFSHRRMLHAAVMLNAETEEFREGITALQQERQLRENGEKQRASPLPGTVIKKFMEEQPRAGDIHCLIYPVYHISGSNPLIATLIAGGTVVIPENRRPGTVLETIETENVTITGGVPTQLKALVEHNDFEEHDTSSLEYVHTAGGLLTPDIRENVVAKLCGNFSHEYASSETCQVAYSTTNTGAIGTPTFLQELRLVTPGSHDPESLEKHSGEAAVKLEGPTVFDGYLGEPGKNREKIRGGWYFTGDILKWDDGELWFEGRVDNMIVSGGENISPGEVEDALMAHTGVVQAGVIGVEDDQWGNRVVAFIDGEASGEELDRYLKQSRLADFKRPKEYVHIEEMPVNETSGVDRRKLRQLYSR